MDPGIRYLLAMVAELLQLSAMLQNLAGGEALGC